MNSKDPGSKDNAAAARGAFVPAIVALPAEPADVRALPESCLYKGLVHHCRTRPRKHGLNYRVFSLFADIDALPGLSKRVWCFSYNRFNLFSLNARDYGSRDASGMRSEVERLLQQEGISTKPVRIMLLTYPRMLGFAFNPLSVFYCYDHRGSVYAMLYEVHNTFGERHTYTLASEFLSTPTNPEATVRTARGLDVDKREVQELWSTHTCDKLLHVSPFAPMNMFYRFRVNRPTRKLDLTIQVSDSEGLMLSAGFSAQSVKLSSLRLLGYFCYYPLMTLKVVVGIHWEALLLWFKRVPWFRHSRVVR